MERCYVKHKCLQDAIREIAKEEGLTHGQMAAFAVAAKEGLFLGDTDGNFKPDDNVTRAQIVTFIFRHFVK